MASFRKRANGWRAEVRMRGHYVSSTWRTRAQAVSWAARVETEIRDGIYRAEQGVSGEELFGCILTRYIEEVSPQKKGGRWEIIRGKALLKMDLAQVPLLSLKAQDIADFRDQRLEEVQPSTVARELNFVSSVLRQCTREWGLLEKNPCADVEWPKRPPPRERRISEQEITAIVEKLGFVENLKAVTASQQTALMFLLALETGMRQGEVAGLTNSQIFLERNHLTLLDGTTKNSYGRDIPLSSRAKELIKLAPGYKRSRSDQGFLFQTSKASVSTLFRRAVKDLKIKNLTFHDSRHEAVTRLARKLNVLALSRVIGHRDIRSLQIYYNETAEEIAKLLD